MPRGPKGGKRPADVVGAAVMVAKIATGEIEEDIDDGKNKAAVELGRKGGKRVSPPHFNVVCRAVEFDAANAATALHAVDQRL